MKNHKTTQTTYYVETDHQGSIIGLLNPGGSYAEKYSYDAWGRRRNPTDWSFNNVTLPTIIDRGYTGHEHLDKFGIIHMNGRMYDPYLGRFLSVDPVIQSTTNSQAFNGYSYCLNNPLRYSDPTGYTVYRIPKENWPALFNDANNGASADELASYADGGDTFTDQGYLDYLTSTYATGGGNGGWFFQNENVAYNYMWLASSPNNSQKKGMEHCAWITGEGVFVHPTSGKDWKGRDLHNTWKESYVNYYQTIWEEGNRLYFLDPIILGKKEVIGCIHTHLPGDVDLGFSPGDNTFTTWLSGIPYFLMDSDNSLHGQFFFNGSYNNPIEEINGKSIKDLTNQYYRFQLIPFLKNFNH